MEIEAACPYCGEPIAIWLDQGGGTTQRYIEDCSVCCRPIDVSIVTDESGEAAASLRRLDE
jgi:hypothetical protein